jgi:hypothetical protein
VKLLGVFYLENLYEYVLSCSFDRDRKQQAEGVGRKTGMGLKRHWEKEYIRKKETQKSTAKKVRCNRMNGCSPMNINIRTKKGRRLIIIKEKGGIIC